MSRWFTRFQIVESHAQEVLSDVVSPGLPRRRVANLHRSIASKHQQHSCLVLRRMVVRRTKPESRKGLSMALIFAMFNSWIVVLRKLASWKHNRLKSKYELVDESFRLLERECKNDEVAVGRPAAYSMQLKLMKLYEALEAAKNRWLASKKKLDKRVSFERKLKKLKGRKVPYSFGLLDMAIVMKVVDVAREANGFDFSIVTDFIQSLA